MRAERVRNPVPVQSGGKPRICGKRASNGSGPSRNSPAAPSTRKHLLHGRKASLRRSDNRRCYSGRYQPQ